MPTITSSANASQPKLRCASTPKSRPPAAEPSVWPKPHVASRRPSRHPACAAVDNVGAAAIGGHDHMSGMHAPPARFGVIVLLVQKITVRVKNPLRDKHLKTRTFADCCPPGAENYASGSLVAGRAVAARA